MKTQKLKIALIGLCDSQKKSKTNKKGLAVIIKANRKILSQIFKSTKLFYLLLFINNSNNSRHKSSFLKKNKKREIERKKEK